MKILASHRVDPLLPGDEPKPDDHPIKILKPGDL